MKRPWILGHRGAPRAFPENTVPAFVEALKQGADGVELDVRLAVTGELVVCHDATLERLTGRAVRVGGCSPWVLAQYPMEGVPDAVVPTLAHVLAVCAGKRVNVEIKTDEGDPEALALATAACVRAHPDAWVVVSSFDPEALLALRRMAPEIRRGLLLSDVPLEAAHGAARGREVAPYSVHPYVSACTPERVADWHGRGVKVFTWTVDDPDEVRRVARASVDAIISNVPGKAIAALR